MSAKKQYEIKLSMTSHKITELSKFHQWSVENPGVLPVKLHKVVAEMSAQANIQRRKDRECPGNDALELRMEMAQSPLPQHTRSMKNEFLRPWKLATLSAGIALLIFGAWYEQLPDWDVGVSILMAVLTYLTAPFACRVIRYRQWQDIALAAFLAWFSIDGSYVLYSEAMRHIYVREANAFASTPLYFMCGLFWMWNGAVREFLRSINWRLA